MSAEPRASFDPFADLRAETRRHQAAHGCGAYVYRTGTLLGVLAGTARARRIVEVGTALGYSALWLAHGAPDALVDTIEADAEHVRLAREQLARHGAGERVRVHHGRAEAVLPRLPADVYDVAFFDGFTPTAPIVDALRERLATGGILIAGNMTHGVSTALLDDLADPHRWLTLSLGETSVSVKRGG